MSSTEEDSFYQSQERQRMLDEMRLQQEQTNQATSDLKEGDNIVAEQLNLEKELEKLEHLLKAEVQVLNKETGQREWVAGHEDLKILTDFGIQLCLNTITFYLNKNTLLSNYDEDTILHKMMDFGISLSDAMFMKYEKVFILPTEEEIQQELKARISKKIDRIILNGKLYSKEYTPEEIEVIRMSIIQNIDLEKERDQIKAYLMKDKLKHFDILMRCIQDSVHSTYLRALFGAERRTLRQHIHVNENLSPEKEVQKQKSGMFSFFKRK